MIGTPNDLDRPIPGAGKGFPEFVTGIATIGEGMVQPGKALTYTFEHVYSTITVLNIGGLDKDEYQKTAGVGQDVTLAAF